MLKIMNIMEKRRICQKKLFLGLKIWFWSIWVGVGHWSRDLTHQTKESGVCKESLTGLWLVGVGIPILLHSAHVSLILLYHFSTLAFFF